ncbi:helix-turn-helix transcriptional regulator [Salmonella enterica subsp. enterica]|jgi:predicted XRE-type DNA-binding protein|uniref:helix-turn-helix domain-containing protein n=1 Tax=Klebsiella TaxID=570 RepID=UPI000DAABCCE|nr:MULTISPECIES: helix-turn-helix transcriptional regulator [Klebsiella]EAM8671794.1 XRE family transcriptional regulator [Salmonella enterica]ECM8673488.1 helix-turn-helix transcriptional regulator [Salmonella enterica subsp. enterica serovar Enteritidis]EDV1001569.1 helix-turn-helix transcriptional regulator [Salmonella enterica subsp. enterica]EEE4193650.1 helix-turn-helix domain-containing protein [Salmonella enterica subsp. enterica serovar Rubislaw]EEJ3213105.1 helix-turn-helix transcrip
MKVKGIPYAEVKAKALQNPDVMAAYLAEKKEEELQELLADLRRRAGINSTQVAERMGITQPAVSKLEKNASKASVSTLERYAAACGASIKIVMG